MPGSEAPFLRPREVLQKIGLRAEQTFVHLGCGAGFWLIPAAHIVGTSGKSIGVDIRPDILSEAESRAQLAHVGQIVKTARVDLEHEGSNGLEAGIADMVLVANIIHQANPDKLLTEAKRLLKPDGEVVVVEWDVAASPIGPPPEKRVALPQMESIAASSGLKKKRSFQASPYHYGIIFTQE